MIKISVVVPVYNGEKYLKRCINSIIGQTFNNWELILINDGSTDLSGVICDNYKNIDRRIRVIHTRNKGVSSARNTGIDFASGDFITFIDCDDWIEKDFFEMAVKSIKILNVDILITGFVFENKGYSRNIFKGKKKEILKKIDVQKEFFKQEKFNWTVYDKFFEKKVVKNFKFNTNFKIGEDMLFCWQVINSIDKIGYSPLYKYHYDISASSTMTSGFSLKWFDSIKVKKLIYNEVKYVSKEVELLSRIVCLIDMVVLLKKAITSKTYNTKRLVILLQKKIRKHVYIIFLYPKSNIMTIRQRLGILYAVLPYKWCKILSKMVK